MDFDLLQVWPEKMEVARKYGYGSKGIGRVALVFFRAMNVAGVAGKNGGGRKI